MVNSFTMNIDVREYLRINPISVHPLTDSQDMDDCFFYFFKQSNEEKFHPETQWNIFKSISNYIFCDMIRWTDGKMKLDIKPKPGVDTICSLDDIDWEQYRNISLWDQQFDIYERIGTFNSFKEEFSSKLEKLLQDVDDKILKLRRNAILNYKGAVELMSRAEQVYSDFNYSFGHIWCVKDETIIPKGEDRVELTESLTHSHKPSEAETTTESLISNRGGWNSVGRYRVGNKKLIAANKTVSNSILNIFDFKSQQGLNSTNPLTYPLSGLNVLDWRYPIRSHNNIPPSLNIYVRYYEGESIPITKPIFSNKTLSSYSYMTGRFSFENINPVEAHYFSSETTTLPIYDKQNVSMHDYLLRLHPNNGTIDINKQSIMQLLVLFNKYTFKSLSLFTDTEFDDERYQNGLMVHMSEIIQMYLDAKLVLKNEFMYAYDNWINMMNEIISKLNTIKELIISIKPITYVGRIIVSVSDDIESKVIAHYGGKHWRRIMNFLRGVNPSNGGTDDNPQNRLGLKFGEQNVCLRQSNIPNHIHSYSYGQEDNEYQWVKFNQGGQETKLIDMDSGGYNNMPGIKNKSINYQISPLENDNVKLQGDDIEIIKSIILPHNNLPPYQNVYIWECIEIDDYEKEILPPESEIYNIRYNMNGHGENPNKKFSYTPYETFTPINPEDVTGWTFQKWDPSNIPLGHTGNVTFSAIWQKNTYTVTFNSNGGTSVPSRSIGYLDIVGELPSTTRDGYSLLGWFTMAEGGEQVSPTYKVTNNVTFYAQWQEKVTPPPEGGGGGGGEEPVVPPPEIPGGESGGETPGVEKTYSGDIYIEPIVMELPKNRKWLWDSRGSSINDELTITMNGEDITNIYVNNTTQQNYPVQVSASLHHSKDYKYTAFEFIGWTMNEDDAKQGIVQDKNASSTIYVQMEDKRYFSATIYSVFRYKDPIFCTWYTNIDVVSIYGSGTIEVFGHQEKVYQADDGYPSVTIEEVPGNLCCRVTHHDPRLYNSPNEIEDSLNIIQWGNTARVVLTPGIGYYNFNTGDNIPWCPLLSPFQQGFHRYTQYYSLINTDRDFDVYNTWLDENKTIGGIDTRSTPLTVGIYGYDISVTQDPPTQNISSKKGIKKYESFFDPLTDNAYTQFYYNSLKTPIDYIFDWYKELEQNDIDSNEYNWIGNRYYTTGQAITFEVTSPITVQNLVDGQYINEYKSMVSKNQNTAPIYREGAIFIKSKHDYFEKDIIKHIDFLENKALFPYENIHKKGDEDCRDDEYTK